MKKTFLYAVVSFTLGGAIVGIFSIGDFSTRGFSEKTRPSNWINDDNNRVQLRESNNATRNQRLNTGLESLQSDKAATRGDILLNPTTNPQENISTQEPSDYLHAIHRIKNLYPDIYDYTVKKQESTLLYEMIKELCHIDPLTAAEIIMKQPHGEFRNDLFYKLSETWRQSDPVASLEWIRSQEGKVGTSTYNNAVYETLISIAKIHPNTALANIELLENSGEKESLMAVMAEGWMAVSSAAAFEWLDTLKSQGASNRLLKSAYTGVMSLYVKENPVDAARLINTIADDEVRWDLTAPLVEGLAETGVEHALEWVLSSGHIENKAYGLMLLTYQGSIEPGKLFDILSDRPEFLAADQDKVLLNVAVNKAAMLDPQLVMDRLDQFPPEIQTSMVNNTISEWYQASNEEVLAWLDSIPPGETYDTATKQIVSDMALINPSEAITLSHTIASQAERLEALTAVLSSTNEEVFDDLIAQIDFAYFNEKQSRILREIVESKQEKDSPSHLFIQPP